MSQIPELIHQFFQVSRTLTNTLNHLMTKYNLTHGQLAIIEYLLLKQSPTSLVEIANYLNVEKSTVTRAVKHLENNQFVELSPSEDSREKRIVIRTSNTAILSSIQQTKDQFEKMAFHNLSEEEITHTLQTLLKIWKNINGDEFETND